MSRKPQWDNSVVDPAQYRLSYAEQLSKKAAFVSKNLHSARQELSKKQVLLSKGIIPEAVKRAIEPPPRKQRTANSGKLTNNRVISTAKPSVPPQEPAQNMKTATIKRTACLRTTNCNNDTAQLETLQTLDLAMKELENAMTMAMTTKPVARSEDLETSFNISPDSSEEENTLTDAVPYTSTHLTQQPEAPSDDFLAGILKQTQLDLQEMHLEEPALDLDSTENPTLAPYEPDLVPRHFALKPLSKVPLPRTGARSIALIDSIPQVAIERRKFII